MMNVIIGTVLTLVIIDCVLAVIVLLMNRKIKKQMKILEDELRQRSQIEDDWPADVEF